ncbi:hypothetical protein ODS41_07980 [Pyrobaculum sp. 3827-6]|uniref:DUF6884 domain-containing protein n=1 Tax=Pyrobaculum sp. 3827-6 TaxID=2983604 RepID=UPI0021D91F2B|nr:DUF6884 domain-containing protein [Pyrobaculum sp. 3827-6]MCU7787847.1 hypothetical protein [Pyrobaculum sp. 3827-6]
MYAVVTNCTREKLDFASPARDLYRGPSVQRIVKVVDEARSQGVPVSLYIISARYGLVGEHDVIEPYDETLSGRSHEEIKRWARAVGLHTALRRLAEANTVILVVTKAYYIAVEDVACQYDVYVLAPFRACGRWIKTGNFDRHIALRKLLKSLWSSAPPEGTRRRRRGSGDRE